ncbi:hypothetical protein R1flu_015415 [Riccia fluitans]|uniref:Uncharacterized protein n=1 Tax=Riccia fluitans TaxID=41844 RepID=A0ABD1YM20_9MARC
MASRSCRREGKSPELPELPEEGELMPQQQQPRATKARQTILPFVEPPIPRPSKYKEFGLPEPKKQLSIKVMEQFILIRGQNNVEGVWCKCKWCGNEERERAAELASLHDMESTSRALDEEEREIESAFPGSIRGEPSSAYAGGPQGNDARPHKSKFSSPSSVANVGTHSNNNPFFSQTLP